MKTINERISEIKAFYIGEERGSGKAFSDSLGLTLANGRNICTPGYSVGLKYVEKILSAYKEVDANWLLTGEGSMLKSEVQHTASLSPPQTEAYLSDREELKKKDETIKLLENHIDFLENVIKTKEGYIVDRDFTIQELNKKMEVQAKEIGVMKEKLFKQSTTTKKGKLG